MNYIRCVSRNVGAMSRMFSISTIQNQWALTAAKLNDPLVSSSPCETRLLTPNVPLLQPSCGLKVKGRMRLRCKDCFYFRREGRLYVLCQTFPRHKQTQMVPKEKFTWILSHAMQSKSRPY